MNGYYGEYDDVALEDFEDDDAFPEFFEDDGELDIERRGRGRGRGGGGRSSRRDDPRGARGGGYNQPRPSSQYVTQTQLQAVATRIGNDVKKLNEADKTLNTRINAGNARLDRHAMAIKKESSARKKADAGLKNTLLLLSIVPLILKPKTRDITATANGLVQGDKVSVVEKDKNDLLQTLLPIGLVLLGDQLGGLLGGLEGGGTSGSSGL